MNPTKMGNKGFSTDDPVIGPCELFVLCRSITEWLFSAGIPKPSVAFGHSLGEYMALCQADVFTEHECIEILRERGKLIAQTPFAEMVLVVTKEGQETYPTPKGIELAAQLTENMGVYVGHPSNIDAWIKEMERLDNGIKCRLLDTKYGFHSTKFLGKIKEPFKVVAHKYFPRRTERKVMLADVISNVDGTFLSSDTINAEYLVKHLTSPVRLDLSLKRFKIRKISYTFIKYN